MPSKTSCFSAALYKKTLARFWPMWGGAGFFAMLIPLYMLIATLTGNFVTRWTPSDFTSLLYGFTGAFVPTVTMIYALCCAMAVWSYQFNQRSVGFFHSLPIKREGLFLTNVLAGLTMLLIPYVLSGTAICLIAAWNRCLDIHAVCITALAVILINVTFFGLATLCAMVTGSLGAMPFLYIAGNFFTPALSALMGSLSEVLIPGAAGGVGQWAYRLAPVFCLSQRLATERVGESNHLTGLGAAAIWGLAGLFSLVLSLLLYRKRRSECAGSVIAHRVLRPVFRYGLGVFSGLSLGWFLYELLWSGTVAKHYYGDRLPMAVSMVICALIGYYVASMLLAKSSRVFRGSWKSALTMSAMMVIVFVSVTMDVQGSTRLPDPEDLAEVTVQTSVAYDTEVGWYPLVGPEQITVTREDAVQEVMTLHKALSDDRERYRKNIPQLTGEQEDPTCSFLDIMFRYKMKDGSRRDHTFRIPVVRGQETQPETMERSLDALYRSSTLQMGAVTDRPGCRLTSIQVENYQYTGGETFEPVYLTADTEECSAIYEALLLDAEEGRLFGGDFPIYDAFIPDVYLYLEFLGADRMFSNRTVHLSASMEHTMQALLDTGVLSSIPESYRDTPVPSGKPVNMDPNSL